nr:hypothetical protein Iba_chr13bCG3140 [Ipomoea batatas]
MFLLLNRFEDPGFKLWAFFKIDPTRTCSSIGLSLRFQILVPWLPVIGAGRVPQPLKQLDKESIVVLLFVAASRRSILHEDRALQSRAHSVEQHVPEHEVDEVLVPDLAIPPHELGGGSAIVDPVVAPIVVVPWKGHVEIVDDNVQGGPPVVTVVRYRSFGGTLCLCFTPWITSDQNAAALGWILRVRDVGIEPSWNNLDIMDVENEVKDVSNRITMHAHGTMAPRFLAREIRVLAYKPPAFIDEAAVVLGMPSPPARPNHSSKIRPHTLRDCWQFSWGFGEFDGDNSEDTIKRKSLRRKPHSLVMLKQ